MGASLIHERYPATRARLPRAELCETPTPVRRLSGLADAAGLGQPLWIKDDSRSAPLWGGNKPRKLEWVLGDAAARGFGTILTFGGLGTNHGLATALYAGRLGMRTVLALVDQPLDEHVEAQLRHLRESAGAVHLTRGTARTAAAVPLLLVRHARRRPPRLPYLLPAGGSSPLGVLGFVEAALELGRQVEEGSLDAPETVVIAMGSGGSAAGLLAGIALAGLPTRVHAVVVNDKLRLTEPRILRLAQRSLELLGSRGADVGNARVDRAALTLERDHMGRGYGHATQEAAAATELAARAESLELDGVYTAKAVAGLLAASRSGSLGEGSLLYWHTHSAVAPAPSPS